MSKKKNEKRYPVLCPWCTSEGRRTVVGWSTVRGSSGICAAHKAVMDAQTARRRERRGR